MLLCTVSGLTRLSHWGDWQQKTINVQIKEERYLLVLFKSLANFPSAPAEMGVKLRSLPFYGQFFLCSSEIKIFWSKKAVTRQKMAVRPAIALADLSAGDLYIKAGASKRFSSGDPIWEQIGQSNQKESQATRAEVIGVTSGPQGSAQCRKHPDLDI